VEITCSRTHIKSQKEEPSRKQDNKDITEQQYKIQYNLLVLLQKKPNTLILTLVIYEECSNIGKNQALQVWRSRLSCIFIYINLARLEC